MNYPAQINNPYSGSDFRRDSAALLRNGYSPLPIRRGTKIPDLLAWSDKCANPMNNTEIEIASFRNPYLGVACGFNSLTGADVDTDEERLQQIIAEVIGKSPVIKRGRRGRTPFYQWEGGEAPNRDFKDRKGGMIIQLLGMGRQTVIPPTVHPETGQPYEWETERTLFNTNVRDLPKLNQAKLEALEEALKPYLLERLWSADESAKFEPLPAGHEFSDLELRRYKSYAATALEGRAADVSETPSGGRNVKLFKAVCRLGKFARHGLIEKPELEKLMFDACQGNGFIKDKGLRAFWATFESGFALTRNDPLPALADRPKPAPDGKRKNPPRKAGATAGARFQRPGQQRRRRSQPRPDGRVCCAGSRWPWV